MEQPQHLGGADLVDPVVVVGDIAAAVVADGEQPTVVDKLGVVGSANVEVVGDRDDLRTFAVVGRGVWH